MSVIEPHTYYSGDKSRLSIETLISKKNVHFIYFILWEFIILQIVFLHFILNYITGHLIWTKIMKSNYIIETAS